MGISDSFRAAIRSVLFLFVALLLCACWDGRIDLFPDDVGSTTGQDAATQIGDANVLDQIPDAPIPDQIADDLASRAFADIATPDDTADVTNVDQIVDVTNPDHTLDAANAGDGASGVVGCLTNADCHTPAALVCEPSLFVCVQCALDTDCAGMPGTKCNRFTSTCEKSCVSNSDCTSPDVCDTSQGACADCLTDTQCAGTGEPKCYDEQCVQCLSAPDCPANKKCWLNTCVTCVTDADCLMGTTCQANHACK